MFNFLPFFLFFLNIVPVILTLWFNFWVFFFYWNSNLLLILKYRKLGQCFHSFKIMVSLYFCCFRGGWFSKLFTHASLLEKIPNIRIATSRLQKIGFKSWYYSKLFIDSFAQCFRSCINEQIFFIFSSYIYHNEALVDVRSYLPYHKWNVY